MKISSDTKAAPTSGVIFDHVSGDLEGGDQRAQLDLLARSSEESLLKLGQLDQQVDPDFLRQLQTMNKQVDFSDYVLKWPENTIKSFSAQL